MTNGSPLLLLLAGGPWTLKTTTTTTTARCWSLTIVCAAVGLVVSPVLLGFAPVGGDPVLMYQPMKAELARALAQGRLPFWSDLFGLGVPLVAESHVAAFYPPNWLFYRVLTVETAYGVLFWLHTVALAAATFAYARCLGIGREGAAMAAVSFSLCGFQAVHAVHEPFTQLMPYLPLCLLLADRYAVTGRFSWLAGLALAWGAQVTLGHFQIQMWTAGLVLLTGGWRLLSGTITPRTPTRKRVARFALLGMGVGWGAAVAWVQLGLTSELTGVSGFVRPPQFLSNFLFPPGHWAQFALPEVFLGRPLGAGDLYWGHQGTTSGEACGYVGVVPLILAFMGFVGFRHDRMLTPWRIIAPLSLALATMPGWWPDGFTLLLQLPGLGWFRAPARYTLLTSLALSLLAGRGLDRVIGEARWRVGLALAVVSGVSAWAWSIHLAAAPDFRAGLGSDTLMTRFLAAGLFWVLGLAAVIIARRRMSGLWTWAPHALTVIELSLLFFVGPAWWSWRFRLPQESPMLERLAREPDVGLVAGRLLNLPVDAGQTTAYPMLGITPPPPNYLLEPASLRPPAELTETEKRWQRRFGVTHGVWGADEELSHDLEVLAEIHDPGLDRIVATVPSLRGKSPWKLVRDRYAFPAAWIARKSREMPNWGRLYSELSRVDDLDEALFLADDDAAHIPDLGSGPAASKVSVQHWDGRAAVVEHDGGAVLILRKTYYPGWTYQLDDGPARPVLKVNGGLQGVPLVGLGTHRVVLDYQPTALASATRISLIAIIAAVVVAAVPGITYFTKRAPA